MSYVYNDEDNEAMNDGWIDFTAYMNKAHADYYESGEYDREQDRRMEAHDMKMCQIREGFLDDLGFDRGDPCRDCHWMKYGVIELFESDADDDNVMPGEAYDLARRMCEVCKAHTGADHDEALTDFFEKEGI